MNIFPLDSNPILAANYHCDQHVIKMITEYSQLLSTAHHILDGDGCKFKHKLFKATHINNRFNIWVRESIGNYMWLLNVLNELHIMYESTRKVEHGSKRVLSYISQLPKNLINIEQTQFSNNIPIDIQILNASKDLDIIESYRNFYRKHKSRFATFGKYNNLQPYWYFNDLDFTSSSS